MQVMNKFWTCYERVQVLSLRVEWWNSHSLWRVREVVLCGSHSVGINSIADKIVYIKFYGTRAHKAEEHARKWARH